MVSAFIFDRSKLGSYQIDSPIYELLVQRSDIVAEIKGTNLQVSLGESVAMVSLVSSIAPEVQAAEHLFWKFNARDIVFLNYDILPKDGLSADVLMLKSLCEAGVNISSQQAEYLNFFCSHCRAISSNSKSSLATVSLRSTSVDELLSYVEEKTSVVENTDTAFVTITSQGYEIGTIALINSVRRFHSDPFVILASDGTDLVLMQEHLPEACYVVNVDDLYVDSPSVIDRRYHNTLSKFYIFAMQRFGRVVFLDSDMIALRRLDFLDLPHLQDMAVFSYENSQVQRKMTSSVMVVRPSVESFKRLVSSVLSNKDYSGRGDHGYLISFYGGKWISIDNANHVSHKLVLTTEYLRRLNPAIIHYHGFKPWDRVAGRGSYLSQSIAHELFLKSLPQKLLVSLIWRARQQDYITQCRRVFGMFN